MFSDYSELLTDRRLLDQKPSAETVTDGQFTVRRNILVYYIEIEI